MIAEQPVIILVLGMLIAALLLAFARLIRGPSLPDRIVALDLMSVLAIGIIAVYAIGTQEPIFLDAAIIVALISFLGIVAFAKYLKAEEERSR